MPPPLTISTGATARTAATTSARRSAISDTEAFCIRLIAMPCSGLPRGLSPTPAMWPSYAISAASSRPGRPAMSRASAAAASGVRIGERLGPIFTRPPAIQNEVSSSMHTRIGAAGEGAAAAIRSSCSAESTITIGRPPSSSAPRSASAARSAVG